MHYIDLLREVPDTKEYLDIGCFGCPNTTNADWVLLSEQRKYKYMLDTDGWGPALRFYKLLGGGEKRGVVHGRRGTEPALARLPACAQTSEASSPATAAGPPLLPPPWLPVRLDHPEGHQPRVAVVCPRAAALG